MHVQGGSNMTGTDCGLFTHKAVPVIFEPPCIYIYIAHKTAIFVTHAIRQTEIPALPDSWVTNTPSNKTMCPQKIRLS